MIGQTLLHYRITDRLGAGGMGEVYRATDTKLGRDVALKVLPPGVAQDPERLGRLRREAQLLASFNHFRIAGIHGLEEAGGQPFLVLELVEGEDLKQRLDRGAFSLDEALEIAKQIAEALEEAHTRGIVHRDLKPANVMLNAGGQVKVLDFGLARAWGIDPGSGSASSDVSASPTMTRNATLPGVILGTAAYMSPEQASGRAVDKRTDIWAFGVVLFEMLTRRPVFEGEAVSEILASVIRGEPHWERLPPGCPPAVRRLLRRCLRKQPADRLQDIGDARLELEDALGGVRDEDEGGKGRPGASPASRGRRRESLAWAAALLLGSLAALLAWRDLSRPSEARPVVRFELGVPEGLSLLDVNLAVSPDGTHVALTTASTEGGVWMWSLDNPAARRLAGTEGAVSPFWSPDGTTIGFFVPGRESVALRRASLTTGRVQTICTVSSLAFAFGGSWSREDQILFSVGDGERWWIHSVSAAGGEATVLLQPDAADEQHGHLWPEFLPDGRRFLFGVDSPRARVRGTWVSTLDPPHDKRLVLPGVLQTRLAGPGHLLYVRDRTLLAQPFDAARAETRGQPSAVASSVALFSLWPEAGIGLFSLSQNGVLSYVEGGDVASELVWFDRRGARLGTVGKPGQYAQIRLSPDEKRVATEVTDPEGNQDLWSLDLGRGVPTRVTFDPARDMNAVWSPDGRELFFSSERGAGTARLYRRRPDQGGAATLLLDAKANAYVESVSPDGKRLVYLTGGPPRNDTVWALPLTGGGEPELLMKADHGVDGPQVSPDGRWLAYASDETGEWEVYAAPFRRRGEKVRVSPEGGRQPRWRGDGKELFFLMPRDSSWRSTSRRPVSASGWACPASSSMPAWRLP